MRQFVLDNQKIDNGIIKLQDKDYKYLRQVLRVKTGDMLNVRHKDGSLNSYTVALIDDSKHTVTLQICAEQQKTITRGVQANQINTANVEYTLFQFAPRPQKLEQIVRQATECGIKNIYPVIGEYSEKSSLKALEASKKERLERIIKEARQQSGSAVDTQIKPLMSLDHALADWDYNENDSIAFVLSERTEKCKSLAKAFEGKNSGAVKKIAIAVGSEGGISPSEINTLLEKWHFNAVHFDVNILRCETAALYGIAAVQTCFSNL
jgi:16S rRNA (uracil1498-N3)-methyltransferase